MIWTKFCKKEKAPKSIDFTSAVLYNSHIKSENKTMKSGIRQKTRNGVNAWKIHISGHRERLRQKFLANGIKSMPQHQILELLLFYAIPRSDTNELGHRLIKRFKDLNGVFESLNIQPCKCQ